VYTVYVASTNIAQELGMEFPAVMAPLVYERDAWLADTLHSTGGKRVVGVVGKGHIAGIQERCALPDVV